MKSFPSILFFSFATVMLSAQPMDAPVAAGAETKAASADRYLDLPGYLAERSAALAIRTRNYDPFGRPKDPSRTPPPSKTPPLPTPDEIRHPRVDPKIAFEQAVAGLKVVMAGENQFTLEGGTTLRKGEYFALSSPEMRFRVQVMSATPRAIRLQETAKGNSAEIRIDSMPSGMSRGGQTRMPGQQNQPNVIPEIESSNATKSSTPGVP